MTYDIIPDNKDDHKNQSGKADFVFCEQQRQIPAVPSPGPVFK